jgi:SAM-dependent methyltransferase
MALLDYRRGSRDTPLIVERDDGRLEELPLSLFFRRPAEFSPMENRALALCRGRVLEVGAGAGQHTLVLQEKGLAVTALDICPQAVEVMKQREVKDAQTGDITDFITREPYDTLLVLGRSIGLVGNLNGLRRFLIGAYGLLNDGGQIILDSLDVTQTIDPSHLEYQKANQANTRYSGEIRLRLNYRNLLGEWYSWLLVRPDTLVEIAGETGWQTEIILSEGGDYLARLKANNKGS